MEDNAPYSVILSEVKDLKKPELQAFILPRILRSFAALRMTTE